MNINDTVKYKMTALGEKVWLEYHRNHGAALRWPQADADGFVTAQLWNVMAIFGPYLWNGCVMPIETEIKVQ